MVSVSVCKFALGGGACWVWDFGECSRLRKEEGCEERKGKRRWREKKGAVEEDIQDGGVNLWPGSFFRFRFFPQSSACAPSVVRLWV